MRSIYPAEALFDCVDVNHEAKLAFVGPMNYIPVSSDISKFRVDFKGVKGYIFQDENREVREITEWQEDTRTNNGGFTEGPDPYCR